MFALPKTLPQAFRRKLEKRVHGLRAPEDGLQALAAVVADTLGAKFAIVSSRVDNGAESVFCTAGGKELSALAAGWMEWEGAAELEQDLAARHAPLSFSHFSWPFSRCRLNEKLSIPADYNLLVPFSSEFIFRPEREKRFCGYALFLFESFPETLDDRVELVVALPDLFSGLYSASRLPRREEFAMYAHDVKHYLMIHEELLRSLEPTAQNNQRRALAKMEKALKQMMLETNSVLLSEKDDSGLLRMSPMRICVNELIAETVADVQPLFEASNITLNVQLDSSVPDSNVDPALFPCVLNNLLDNALKYSTTGGEVSLLSRREGDDAVIIEISNTGLCIPPAEQALIFSRYYRATNVGSRPGHGLGLYLVKRIVEDHGGTVSLVSSSDERTSFALSLPVAREERD